MNLAKITTGIAMTGTALAGGIDATVLNETPVRAEYALTEHVTVEQKENVVEATLPWKGERGLTVKYDMGTPTLGARIRDKRDKQVVVEQISNDSMKMDIILHSKPDTNKFCYQIEGWEDYDFELQPPLTEEEVKRGMVRPEEIEGSYAVYHKRLKNQRNVLLTDEELKTIDLTAKIASKEIATTTYHGTERYVWVGINYETGKFAHIPYPYIWSANATSTTKHRAEAFDITDGRMCVTMAESDDTMEYPVRIDPTFGYTSVGASNNIIAGSSDTLFCKATLSESGTLDSISAYTKGYNTSAGSYGIYKDSDKTKVGNTSETSYSGTLGWQTRDMSDEAVSAGDYWIGMYGSGTGPPMGRYTDIKYDSSSGASKLYDTNGTWPSSVTISSWDVRLHSIYATYTVSGGGSTPVDGPRMIIFE